MYRTFFVFLKCTTQDGPKVDVLLIAFLYFWLKFWEGIDKYWIVPVRNLFYFHHWGRSLFFYPCSFINKLNRAAIFSTQKVRTIYDCHLLECHIYT